MTIKELTSLTPEQTSDLKALMAELDADIAVSADMLLAAAGNPSTHLFAAIDNDRVVGCASLCITVSPTGRKGGIEDVVVSNACRGCGIGRMLIEHMLQFARENYAPIEMHLTSRPAREAANRLYQKVGFSRYDTNVYKLKIN